MNKEEYEIMYRLEDTHWWYVGMRRIVFDFLKHIAKDGQLSVLDAGCGTGGMLQHLRQYGTAVGVDICQEALEFSQQRGLKRLVMASVGDLPFESASFDLIVSFDVLYHMAVEDDIAALKEFRRLLKPGGHVLLRLPACDWLRGSHDEAVHTRQRYSASDLREKMHQAGFTVKRLTYANSILFPAAALKRVCEMSFKLRGGSDVKEVSPIMNTALTAVLGIEAKALKLANLPWGLSVFALGKAI
ncbi:MAG: class I SAM-dependent methyltransferase [Chloroflexi bacterium]|nr:class I SAM-dependent methyltransferase [Chloroflexota bacterium]MDA8189507.1 class I SAM-dependent methyltransferase [Dehalococcoidales bacterium]